MDLLMIDGQSGISMYYSYAYLSAMYFVPTVPTKRHKIYYPNLLN